MRWNGVEVPENETQRHGVEIGGLPVGFEPFGGSKNGVFRDIISTVANRT